MLANDEVRTSRSDRAYQGYIWYLILQILINPSPFTQLSLIHE
jgi:hypothetical protein